MQVFAKEGRLGVAKGHCGSGAAHGGGGFVHGINQLILHCWVHRFFVFDDIFDELGHRPKAGHVSTDTQA